MSGTAETNVFTLNKLYQLVVDGQVVYNGGTTLWAWGSNCFGQLGQNNIVTRSSPVQIPGNEWSSISAGVFHSIVLKTDSSLWVWGSGPNGELGDNTTVAKSSPVQIPGTTWVEATATAVNLARKSDGTLWAWGGNGLGGLGQNDRVSRSSPVQIPGTSWASVATGGPGTSHILARKSDGTLWSWGWNSWGQLGVNDRVFRSSPVQIPGTSWISVSISATTTFARKSDNTLWSWGDNSECQLGQNLVTSAHRSSPTQIPGTSWVEVVGGAYHAIARKSDGTIWSWGYNCCGQLGQNTVGFPIASPAQIPGTSWVQIAAGQHNSHARKSDGTLWGWGSNLQGQLGIGLGGRLFPPGDCSSRSSPVQIPGTLWIDVVGAASSGYIGPSNLRGTSNNSFTLARKCL